MARIINGALYVDAFTATENSGEYVFENALFNNQNDITGNGAFDLAVGFVIFIPATNRDSGAALAGVSNRYKFTSLQYIDQLRVSGTIIWDSSDEEIDVPTNGTFCLVSQTTPNLGLALTAPDNFYPDVLGGSTLAAMLSDIINIMDKLGTGSGALQSRSSTILPIITDGQTTFSIPHVPTDKTSTILTVNGMTYVYGESNDYTIDGSTLTWMDYSMKLDTTDSMVINYSY